MSSARFYLQSPTVKNVDRGRRDGGLWRDFPPGAHERCLVAVRHSHPAVHAAPDAGTQNVRLSTAGWAQPAAAKTRPTRVHWRWEKRSQRRIVPLLEPTLSDDRAA